MANKNDLFLDTSTQVARHWHSPPECEEIYDQLKGLDLYCSQYVKCQYKATLLASLIKLHNLRLRSQDLLEAIQKATEGKYTKEAGGKLTGGVLALIVDIAYWISRHYKTYTEQVERLRDLIEDGWETIFNDGLELPLIDETGCVYAEGDPVLGESGAYRPIKVSCTISRPAECRIREFWDKHRIHLEVLTNMNPNSIEAEPKDTKELEKVKEHAKQIMRGEPPHGQRCTVHLSDAIICLESTHCPVAVAVHSTNKKHFRPLGEMLGVESEPMD